MARSAGLPGSSAPGSSLRNGPLHSRPWAPVNDGRAAPAATSRTGKTFAHVAHAPLRHRKIVRDTILGVTNGDVRRLARRGGVKRISGQIYTEARTILKSRLERILGDICAVLEYKQRRTVTVEDVVFALRRLGTPVVGFGDTHVERPDPVRPRKSAGARA